jgi:spore coat polysaccharide biosynthesis protein SpsF
VKAGIIVLCRFASRRLPGKILREIGGRTVLGHIVDRIRRGAADAPITVATSDESSDDAIAHYCRHAGLDCFRGPLADVAGRFIACAEARGYEFAVRINGDNLFADPDALRSMLAITATGEYDFVTNVPGRTFPYGMSVEIVRIAFFRATMASVTDAGHREHVTTFLYENPELGRRFVFENTEVPEAHGMKLALDTEADLRRAESMIARMDRAPATYVLAEIARLSKLDWADFERNRNNG